MGRISQLEKWEERLLQMMDEVDAIMEQKYCCKFKLKPNRLPHKTGITRDSDGLFDLGISFSAGLTSKYGPGYVFQVRIATSDQISAELQNQIEEEILSLVKTKLPKYFPGLDINVAKEGKTFRIYGDLSLDKELPPIQLD